MKRFYFLSVSAAAVLLTLPACSNVRKADPQVAATPDKVSAMLAEAADRASVALETLAAVEQARTPEAAVGPAADVPVELQRAITVNWVGPVEPIVQTLADRAGYMFQPVGSSPPVPVVVSVDVENRPVMDVLRNIGLQMGNRADIKIDGARRMVEVHYAPAAGGGG